MSKVKDAKRALSLIANASHRCCSNSGLSISKSIYCPPRRTNPIDLVCATSGFDYRNGAKPLGVFKYKFSFSESKNIIGCGCKSFSYKFSNSNSYCTTAPNTAQTDVHKGNKSRDHNLIVKGLPLSLSDEEFYSLCSAVGPVDSCIIWRDKATGNSRGFGFVNFQHSSDAQQAIQALSGFLVQGKPISVSLASLTPEQSLGRNLLVRKIPTSWTEVDLEKVFIPYGKIVQSCIKVDLATGSSIGLGYVCFEKTEEATRALKGLHGTIPEGATGPIYMKFCEVKRKKKLKRIEFPQDSRSTSLLVKNLPQNLTDSEFQSVFQSVGPVKRSMIVRDNLTGTSYGFGYVSFEKSSHAKQAIKTLSGSQIQDKKISMELAPQSKAATEGMAGQTDEGTAHDPRTSKVSSFGGTLASPGPHSETFGEGGYSESSIPEEPEVEDFSNVDLGELSEGVKVLIKNVPSHWGRSQLEKLFKPHGKVVPYGVSKTGYVSYGTHCEARRAVNSLNKKIPSGATEPLIIKFVTRRLDANSSEADTHAGQDTISSELIVKNLPLTMSDGEFKSLFAQFGPIRSAEVQRDKTIGISYGFGFVRFERLKDAHNAIEAMSGHQVGRNSLNLTLANPVKPLKSDDRKNGQGDDPQHTRQLMNRQGHLMIGSLPADWTKDTLLKLFEPHGIIIHCSVMKTYTACIDGEDVDLQSVMKCLNQNVPEGAAEPVHIELVEESGQHCQEEDMAKLCVTRLAPTVTDKELEEMLRDIGPLKTSPKIKQGQSMGHCNVHFEHAADAKRAIKRLSGLLIGGKKIKLRPESYDKEQFRQTTLFVSRIPESWQEADVIEYFEPYGNVMEAEVPLDPTTFVSKRFAFVRFETRKEARFAKKCVEVTVPEGSKDALHIRFMRPSLDKAMERSKDFLLKSVGSSESPRTLDLNATKLMIKNFPLSMSDEEISDMFQHIGPVKSCYIHSSKTTGKRFDYGFVDFLHPEDARLAIDNVHGLVILGKKMTVKFARKKEDEAQKSNITGLETQESKLSKENTVTSDESQTLTASNAEISECVGFSHSSTEAQTGNSVYVSRRERRRMASAHNSDGSSRSRGRSAW